MCFVMLFLVVIAGGLASLSTTDNYWDVFVLAATWLFYDVKFSTK